MKRLLLLLFACLALVGAGCGGDDDDKDSGGGGDTGAATDTAPADDAASAGSGETAKVDMKDIQYVPKEITVKNGTTITWTNSDQVAHTVTHDSGPGDFDSGNIEPGKTFEQKFDEPGDVGVICTIHPNQTGTVTVE